MTIVCKRLRLHLGICCIFVLKWLALLVHYVGVLYICLQRFAGGLLLLVGGLSTLAFSLCIYHRSGLKWFAMCVHAIGMWMQMLAKLCFWFVVACLWFDTGGFIVASMIGLYRNC